MPRELIWRDGELVQIIDDRTLEEAQAETIAHLQAQLEQRIIERLGVTTREAAVFKEINAARGENGPYTAEQCAQIHGVVDGLYAEYRTFKAAILHLTSNDELAEFRATWSE